MARPRQPRRRPATTTKSCPCHHRSQNGANFHPPSLSRAGPGSIAIAQQPAATSIPVPRWGAYHRYPLLVPAPVAIVFCLLACLALALALAILTASCLRSCPLVPAKSISLAAGSPVPVRASELVRRPHHRRQTTSRTRQTSTLLRRWQSLPQPPNTHDAVLSRRLSPTRASTLSCLLWRASLPLLPPPRRPLGSPSHGHSPRALLVDPRSPPHSSASALPIETRHWHAPPSSPLCLLCSRELSRPHMPGALSALSPPTLAIRGRPASSMDGKP
jgi:hypothetical protein